MGMLTQIGQVEAIFRYPVKSMGGERLDAANLGWHGIDGDRRLVFRRMDDRSGFPWLTATKVPELLLFHPVRREDGDEELVPTHIRTPDGKVMPVFGEDLAAEVARRYGSAVEMMNLRHGIFDDACMSVIATETVGEIARLGWAESGRAKVSPQYSRPPIASGSLSGGRVGWGRAFVRRGR
jgi:uncharacterized protein